MKPIFQFSANNAEPDDKCGTATWVYQDLRHDAVKLTQRFNSFAEAFSVNELVLASWAMGEEDGYAECERHVLHALSGAKP